MNPLSSALLSRRPRSALFTHRFFVGTFLRASGVCTFFFLMLGAVSSESSMFSMLQLSFRQVAPRPSGGFFFPSLLHLRPSLHFLFPTHSVPGKHAFSSFPFTGLSQRQDPSSPCGTPASDAPGFGCGAAGRLAGNTLDLPFRFFLERSHGL